VTLGAPATIIAGATGQAVTVLDVAAAGTAVAAGLVYEDGTGGHLVAYASHNGTSWDAPVPVTAGAPTSVSPADVRAAISGDGMLHLVWSDGGDLDGAADDRDLYYFRHDLAAVAADVGPLLVNDALALGGYTDGAVGSLDLVADTADTGRVWVGFVDTGDVGLDAGVAKVLALAVDDGAVVVASVMDVSAVAGRAAATEVAVATSASGLVTFVWVESGAVAGAGAGDDVLSRARLANGSLAPGFTVVSAGDDVSRHPALAQDAGGDVAVLWQDDSGADASEPYVFVLGAP